MNSLAIKIYHFHTELFKSGQQKNDFEISILTLTFKFY